MTLKIERDGAIVIRVPEMTTKGEIDDFYRSKIPWISKQLKEHKETIAALASPKRYVTGENFLYLGDEYPLQHVENVHAGLALSRGVFTLGRGSAQDGREAFIKWYKARAKEIFGRRVGHYSKLFNLVPRGIRVTSARSRYGSCSPGNNLSFSYRLVMAPYSVIDYIIVHELAHIKIKNHSKHFWEFMAELMPDYRQHKLWLKKKGHLLEI